MLGEAHYHCNFRIQRDGHAYGIDMDSLISSIDLFLQKNENPFFTIGSSRDAYIYVKYLAPAHATCIFSDKDLIVYAGEVFHVTQGTQKQKLAVGEKIKYDTSKSLGSFLWKMTFDEKTRIAGRISEEQEVLPEGTIYHLQSHYGPLQKIQEGKSSLILKSEDEKVLKILRPAYVRENKNVVRRFINAARRYQTIAGEEFLPIHDIVYHRDYDMCYVVTDNFPGETLKNYLARKGILSVKESVAIVCDLAKKLSVLQDYKYVCRNLNPGNIIRNSDGEMRITSFFLLKTDINMTVLSARMIIPNYTAPEQISDPSSVDILSDMFSLGAIFYNLLLGEPPFKTTTTAQYEESVSIARPITAQEIQKTAPEVPVEICEIMARLLSLDKKQRPDPKRFLAMLGEKEFKEDPLSDSLMEMIDAACDKIDLPQPAQEQPPGKGAKPSVPERKIESAAAHRSDLSAQDPEAALLAEDSSSELFSQSALHMIDNACQEALKQSGEKGEIAMTAPQSQSFDAPLNLLPGAPDPGYVALLEKVSKAATLQGKGSHIGYCIAIIEGPGETELIEYNFPGDHTVIIGREGNFCILHDSQVSRQHAQLQVIQGKCWLSDLNSANGTYVDGEKITRREITVGTRFSLGDTIFLFKNSDATMGGILKNPQEELSDEDFSQLKSLKITSAIPRMTRQKKSRPQPKPKAPPAQSLFIPEPVLEAVPIATEDIEEAIPAGEESGLGVAAKAAPKKTSKMLLWVIVAAGVLVAAALVLAKVW